MRVNFGRSYFSYPPRVWRGRGWQRIEDDSVCYLVLLSENPKEYDIERVFKLYEEPLQEGESCQQVKILDRKGDEWSVAGVRLFRKPEHALVEAVNLNLWIEQYERAIEERRKMGKKWNPSEVSEMGGLAPVELLTVKITDCEETQTSDKTGNKYMISIKGRIQEPRKAKNMPYNVNFVIGNDDDPDADEAETWSASFAASRYKSFLKANDVPETGDIEEELESLEGSTYVVDNAHSDDGKYNQAQAFYRVSAREEDAPAAKASGKSKPAPKPERSKPAKAKRAPEPELDDDEDESDEEWDD